MEDDKMKPLLGIEGPCIMEPILGLSLQEPRELLAKEQCCLVLSPLTRALGA